MRLTGNVLSSLELTVGANTIMKEPDLDEEEDDVVPTAMLSANTGTGGSSSGYSSGSAAVTDGEPEGLTLIMPSLTYLYLDHNQFERVINASCFLCYNRVTISTGKCRKM